MISRAVRFLAVAPAILLTACGGGVDNEPQSLWRVVLVIAVGVIAAAYHAMRK
jgi:hypothetical protein